MSSPSVVKQYLGDLLAGEFPSEPARGLFEQLKDRMSTKEQETALAAIAKLEAEGMRRKRLKRSFIDVVPPGFLQDYLSFVQVSESPDSFHLFSILGVLSHMLGRRVWFPMGPKRLTPSLSVFLVSPAGQARRSTAIRLAVDIGRAAGANVVQDQATPEGLIATLSTQPNLMVVADEAANLLSKREYMADMPALLCTLLDNPDMYQRVLKGQFIQISEPTTNALVGCAPEWIISALPRTALGGGLLSRMLVVYEATRKMLIPLPDDLVEADLMDEMRRSLVVQLRQIAENAGGPLVYTPEAKERFRLFYAENDHDMNDASEKMTVYFSRKPDHVHRLNLLLSAAVGTAECDLDLMDRTLTLLQMIEIGMEIAYRQAGLEKPGQLQLRILNALDKANRLAHSELLHKVSDVMDANTMKQVIGTLAELGELEIRPELVNQKLVKVYYRTRR